MSSSDKGLVYFMLTVIALTLVVGVLILLYVVIEQISPDWLDCGKLPPVSERGQTITLYCADPDGNIWQVEAVLNSIKETQ